MGNPSSGMSTGARAARWSAAVVVLLIAALLGGLSVVAGYMKSQVLNTDHYVQTVAPIGRDPAVQAAIAQRLTTVIIDKSGIDSLTDNVLNGLVARGAPGKLTSLAAPLESGLSSLLNGKLKELMATPQFATAWTDLNRTAHTAFVTVLTGTQGRFLNSSGTTVTIDLGEILSVLRDQLVAAGLTFVSAVPNLSIPYTLVDSDQLPTIRTYARILDVTGTWLPYVALALLIAGVLIAPNRRRGVLTGVTMLGLVTALLLVAIAVGRQIYLNHLPPTVQSPTLAEDLFNTITRFLVQALQALLVAVVIVVVAGLLAGPGRFPVWLRSQWGRAMDATGRGLGHAGEWTRRIGPGTATIRKPLEIGLVILGAVLLILIEHPTPWGVVVMALCVLVAVVIIEVLTRVTPPTSTA